MAENTEIDAKNYMRKPHITRWNSRWRVTRRFLHFGVECGQFRFFDEFHFATNAAKHFFEHDTKMAEVDHKHG